MALPSGFEGPEEYFEGFFNFLQKYEYLFNFSNTDLLVSNCLEKIEMDFQDLDVFKENFDIRGLNCDYSMDFFENLDQLKVEYDEFKENVELQFLIDVPLSVKKKHEIAYLAKEIEDVCKTIECDTVVDFGSGLGYLDEQLYKTTGFNVLGLECSETNYVGAKKRQRKYHIESIERVKYVKHTIKPDSYVNIQDILDDKFPKSKHFCIVGLHACADLTVDAIDIFLKMERARAIVIMPCCYHRIKVENDKNGRFKNFPLSRTLKVISERTGGLKYLTVPFLRLATQPPNVQTEKLEDLVFNLLARATLQVYANKNNCKLRRIKRKAVRLKSLGNSFEAYAADAIKGFKLICNKNEHSNQSEINLDKINEDANDIDKEFVLEDLLLVWRQICEMTFKKAAMFVLFQNCMQPVFENFVLYDRLVYLQENGVDNCIFKRIVNEKISPRSLALLALK